MYRILTVAREYGSGGAQIAHMLSEHLNWELLDNNIITEIARAARVDPELARRYDERVDSWAHRIARRGLWRGTFDGIAIPGNVDVFDGETMALLTRNIIIEAFSQGHCVIVGRGAQCILQDRPEVFHVFIYGPWAQRVARVRRRFPNSDDIPGLVRAADQQRIDYVRLHFGCHWADPHLYHLLVSSVMGEKVAVSTILCAMNGSGHPETHEDSTVT